MAKARTDADSPWKEALERYLRECLALFLPEAHADIDWSRPPQFLDGELRQAMRRSKTGARRVDRLIRVWLLDGTDAWVLIHVEVQGRRDRAFAERMYLYQGRIYDHYRREVISAAILADDRPSWRPALYERGRWGCRTRFEYPVIKLLDWRARRAELEASDNPFATIVLAHLAAQETRADPAARTRAKLGLVRRLYERGYDRERVVDLFRFIDWLMVLPEAAEAEVWREIERLEEEGQMPYITSVERIGVERGKQEGRLEGKQEGRLEGKQAMLRRQAHARFGALPDAVEAKIAAADEATLDAMADRVIVAATVEDL